MATQPKLRYVLKIKSGDSERYFTLENEEIYSIGRHSSNSIVIDNPQISRHHCLILPVIYKQKNDYHQVYWIIDGDLKGNRSTNGLFINENRSLSHELQVGDTVTIGKGEVRIIFQLIDSSNLKIIESRQESELTPETIINENEKTLKTLGELQDDSINNEAEIISLIEEITLTLFKNDYERYYPVFEIDLEGKICYSNSIFRQTFTNLRENFEHYSPTKNLAKEIKNNLQQIHLRQIEYHTQTFAQISYYIEEKTKIRSFLINLSQRNQIETALTDSEEKYRAVVQQISEGIVLIDPISKEILEANTAYCNLVKCDSREILRMTIYDLVAIDDEIIDSIFQKIQEQKLNIVKESVHCRQDGSLVEVEANISLIKYHGKTVICYAVRDISEKKKSADKLRYHANHDDLTKLPNRQSFKEELQKNIERAKKFNYQFAVIFADLDRFKNINDSLGHDLGDQFLQKVASRLDYCLRKADLIARWGADEFTILLSHIRHSSDVHKVATRILNSLNQPFSIFEYKLYASLSMGVAIYPQDGDSSEILLKNADTALYKIKEQGKGSYCYYDSSMGKVETMALKIENYLHDALKNQEFELYYQPLINLNTQKVVGMEALLRWYNPELGQVSPAHFIPIAEETRLMKPIGQWVLLTACEQNKIWQRMGLPPITVSVNISAKQFQESSLIKLIDNILGETNLEPKYLELEVTETSIITNPDIAQKTIEQIHNLGVSVSLDDFCTGYSSLSHLKKFSFNKIKIDHSFVKNLTDDPQDLAIVSAILTIGKGFNVKVVAEGIENAEQLRLLSDLECDIMQGYFFSRPLPVKEATAYIQSVEERGLLHNTN